MSLLQFLARATHLTNPLLPEQYRALRERRVREYFPDSLGDEPNPGEILPASVGPEALRVFHHDFTALIEARRNLQGMIKAGDFVRWWQEQQAAYLTRPAVDSYKEADLTLGELLDELHLRFMAGAIHERSSSRAGKVVQRVVRNRVIVTLFLSLVFLGQGLNGFFWKLLILGPGVQMVNSYTQPVITPLAQTASQVGARDLGPAAASVQSWLSNREQLKQVKEELQETTSRLRKVNFNALSPEQARAKWAKFEESYFQLFMKYNQTLPSHLREGRSVFKDWVVFTPVGLAANLATFDTQYWMHRSELERLERSGKRDSLRISLHQREMKAAESRIAGALAAWKLFEFMYPELTRGAPVAKARADFQGSYNTFTKAMRFDAYVQQFASRMEEVLRAVDTSFYDSAQATREAKGMGKAL